ncbi:hypothetical protein [Streptomyces sp. YIM S03343]
MLGRSFRGVGVPQQPDHPRAGSRGCLEAEWHTRSRGLSSSRRVDGLTVWAEIATRPGESET